jgi:hypothetical protein
MGHVGTSSFTISVLAPEFVPPVFSNPQVSADGADPAAALHVRVREQHQDGGSAERAGTLYVAVHERQIWFIRCLACGARNIIIPVFKLVGWR